MENRDYIIGIDIGSSNVVMAAAVRLPDGRLDILGVDVQSIGEGVEDGCVNNLYELGNAISRGKQALENELGRRIDSAYVGISGREVYCVQYEDSVQVKDKEGCITDEDVRELETRIERVVAADKDKILGRHPLRYRIDGMRETEDPRGCFGQKLSAIYLMELVSRQQEDRINRAMHRAGIECSGLVINPMVLPLALLSAEERKGGVAIVDLGSDLTDIVVVRGDKVQHFASLPIGASSIDADLYEFLKIPQVDKIKKSCCSVLSESVPNNTTISVQMMGRGRARKQLLQRNISEIIEERLKDIARFVLRELRGAKCVTKLPYGVVLTGGSAYLADIEQLFSRELGIEVRLGRQLHGISDASSELIAELAQATAIGILQYGSGHMACKTTEQPSTHTSNSVEVPKEESDNKEPVDIFHQGGHSNEGDVEPTDSTLEPVEQDEEEEFTDLEEEIDEEEMLDDELEEQQPEESDKHTEESDTNGGKKRGKIERLIGSLVDTFNSALGYSDEI